jgi:uncharacterized damage-inducible protein DinB
MPDTALPMDPGMLGHLLAYHRWATSRLLDSLLAVPAEALHRPVGGSFGSAHGLLVHMLAAERIWMERLQGRSPTKLGDLSACTTADDFQAEWQAVQTAQRAFLQGLGSERLGTPLSYTNFAGEVWTYPLGTVLLHVVNHGTYHRGQLAHVLRQLGQAPPPTDYLVFADETRQQG